MLDNHDTMSADGTATTVTGLFSTAFSTATIRPITLPSALTTGAPLQPTGRFDAEPRVRESSTVTELLLPEPSSGLVP